jgi:tetratricopeptide (TPR) repeat protein
MSSGANVRRGERRENLARAVEHLEQAVRRQPGGLEADINLRAMLARVYVIAGTYDKGIALLTELVKQEPGWQDGATLLVEAYALAGRSEEAVRWLEDNAPGNPQLYGTLADFYGRSRRWREASAAYERALALAPDDFDLRVRYASMLLNAGGAGEIVRARDTLREAVAQREDDERALSLLSQAERRAGDLEAAASTARRLISRNRSNPRGYLALAEVLEERRRFQEVIDVLAPALSLFRSGPNPAGPLTMLLPHVGFAYQQLKRYDEAIGAFEEAARLAPRDAAITGYLVQTYMAAGRYQTAIDLARAALAGRPGDVRLTQLQAEALLLDGQTAAAITLAEGLVQSNGNNPLAHIALAQVYAAANRTDQSVKVLQTAEGRFPTDASVAFELGAALERQKNFAEAEAVFRRIISREPEHAPALNYLGYMLADRGERLAESVDLIMRALEIEPDNGSYLDSLGWAYFKDGKLELAEEYLRRAAEQLTTNSVVQDHYGDVLFRLGRFNEAIAAWMRALDGDGESIDRGDLGVKIRAARQKLPRQ